MVDVAISSGHGKFIRGAKGVLDEVDENRKVVDRVAALLRGAGVSVRVFHDDSSRSVSANLGAIIGWHNSQKRDRDISCHFNAFRSTSNPMGTEVCFKTQQALAAKVSSAMAVTGRLFNRGAKKRNDLGFLNRCSKPAILLEVCFVDSSADAALYRANFEAICRGIAETIADVKLPGQPPPVEPPPVEPPPEPPPEPELTGENVADISIEITGNVQVLINSDPINDYVGPNKLDLTLAHAGDVVVTVNGEDFQIAKPPSAPRPTLKNGSRGQQVRYLQDALGVKPVDGIFGIGTENAVKKFQTDNGLTADGVVGTRTWFVLEKVFDLPPYEPPSIKMFEDIKASVFGGSKDPNKSAYSPFDNITDTELSVALPWKFVGLRPRVWVKNRANGKEVVCQIRDLGPWLLDDDYWENDTRPLAETCFKNKQPLPRGPHKGKVPNGAGIDLTPGAARAIGLSGLGQVDWRFETEAAVA